MSHELEDDKLVVLSDFISHGEFEEAQKIIDTNYRKTVEIDVETIMVMTPTLCKTSCGMLPELMSTCKVPSTFFDVKEIETCFKVIYAAQRTGKKTVTCHVAAPCREDTQSSATTLFRSVFLLALQSDFRFTVWNPQTHEFFPWCVQEAAQSMLMLHNRDEPNLFNAIPLEMVHRIIEFVSAPPFVWRKRCFACGEHKIERFLRCSRCHIALYCSKDCQKKHYSTHRRDCGPPPKFGCKHCDLAETLHPFKCEIIDPQIRRISNVYQTSFNY